jgi:SAM-dependent methyltransferase
MSTVTTADFWDAEADDFDEQPDHGLRDPTLRAAWADLLLPLMAPSPARVADLGCGTGSLSLLLAEAGHHVSGLDISPAMVALARAKVAGAGYGAEFTVGDAAAPPWRPRSFDVVLTRHVLWAMEDPDEALTRWIDLLAPQGRLVLIEGRWWTGAGMSALQVSDLVHRHRVEAEVTTLNDAVLWGESIHDERFAVVSRC